MELEKAIRNEIVRSLPLRIPPEIIPPGRKSTGDVRNRFPERRTVSSKIRSTEDLTMKTGFVIVALTIGLLAGGVTGASLAADEVNVSTGGTMAGKPLALHGYDPVAYFTDGKPVIGDAGHSAVYNGAAYYFASADHKKTFEANPARYAPAYGGFCAYGVGVGKKFDGSPQYWTVKDGKLYLNVTADISRKFAGDLGGNIKKAEKNWGTIEHKAVGSL
jgi:YHS domain-containing protein